MHYIHAPDRRCEALSSYENMPNRATIRGPAVKLETEILVPYFKAGLESSELCMWVTSEPLGVEEAKASLGRVMGDLDDYLRNGQLEIVDAGEWYTECHGTVKSGQLWTGQMRPPEVTSRVDHPPVEVNVTSGFFVFSPFLSCIR